MNAMCSFPFGLFETFVVNATIRNRFYLFLMLSLVSTISVSPAYSAQIDIPLDTWVARPLPGYGKSPAEEMKHMRVSYNPVNGRLYYLGGDFGGPVFGQSGRNEVYSYDVETDTWIQEQPYCRPDKGYQPAGPDQVGWTYDSNRKVFWMFPGYMTRPSQSNCPESTNVLLGEIMSFDPATNTWAFENRTNSSGGPSIKKVGNFDPVTDTFLRFAWVGSPRMEIYHVTTDTWEYVTFGSEFDNSYLGWDYNALDLVDRVMYVVSALEGKLLKYDLDAKTLTHISDLPTGTNTPREGNYALWDSVNRVMLWSVGGSKSQIDFYVYHPTDKRWEQRPINQPQGYTVKGNAAAFDPVQNVFVLIGGYEPANPYVFLYRYANGDGTPPAPVADTTPPSVISARANSNGNELSISYSERVNQTDAENAANYAIDGVTVNQATLAADQRTVTLAVSALTDGAQYQIVINNIHDMAETPNTIANNTTASVTYVAPSTDGSTTVPSEYQWDTLAIGKEMYIDRTYTFSDIPDGLLGFEYLKTRNDDKSENANPFVSFTIDAPKAVYVAYDMRIDPLPTWLQSWQSTSYEINGTDFPLKLYRKDFEAGTVNLGGNEYGKSMYLVALGGNSSNGGNDPAVTPATPGDSGGGGVNWMFLAALMSILLAVVWRSKQVCITARDCKGIR